MLDKLPEVAKSFVDHCTKCDGEKYHRVLSHVDEKSAKVQCEICGKKKTFKLKSPKAAKKKSARVVKSKAQPAGGDWRLKMDQKASDAARSYSMKEKFILNDKIEHTKFGIGFVLNVSGDRMTVLFEAGEKTLLHSK